MHQQLSKSVSLERVVTVTAGAAGTSDINSTAVDMAGFEGVMFLVQMGAIVSGAVTSVKVQQSDDDGSSDDYTDVEGTAQTVADNDDEEVFYVDVFRPRKRYVRLVVDRGTQNATCSAVAVKYGPTRKMPTTHGTGVNGETHVSPAEGTA